MNGYKPTDDTADVVLYIATIAAIVTTLSITGDLNSTLVLSGFLVTFVMQRSGNRKADQTREQIVQNNQQIAETKVQVAKTMAAMPSM